MLQLLKLRTQKLLISYFSNKEDALFGGNQKGDTIGIGCWIGESTKARILIETRIYISIKKHLKWHIPLSTLRMFFCENSVETKKNYRLIPYIQINLLNAEIQMDSELTE